MSIECLIETRCAPPFYKNGYVLACAATSHAVLVDPGEETQELIDLVERRRWEPQAILLTHAHIDHITGVGLARSQWPVPIYLHREDLFLYEALPEQGQRFGVALAPPPAIDHFFADGEKVQWGKLTAEVIHTPGHTPGGVCLKIGEILVAGDTLFAGSIGRTDLPGGDYDTLIRSIHSRLFPLPDETTVYSGHGPATTIGEERRFNPFLR